MSYTIIYITYITYITYIHHFKYIVYTIYTIHHTLTHSLTLTNSFNDAQCEAGLKHSCRTQASIEISQKREDY